MKPSEILDLIHFAKEYSQLQRKERKLEEDLDGIRSKQTETWPNIFARCSSLKIAVLRRLIECGSSGLTPKELHRDRLRLTQYTKDNLPSRVETYSMCLRRLKAAGYAEGANEGRTRRYYENAEGRAYLKFVSDEIMRRERSHQLWFYSVMSGFWKLIDMDKVQLTLDKFPPVSNVDFFRRLSPWVKTIREAGTDVQLIQLITMNEDWLTARDAIITFTDQVLGMLQSLVNEMLWIPAIELLF